MFNRLWDLIKEIHYNQVGGTGTAVATGDVITAAKMNLKLETIVDADLTHDSGDWTIGEDGAGQDIIFYTDTAGRVMTWDPSDSSLELDDDVIIAFGSADDVEVKWDTAKLLWLPLTDDTGIFQIGDGTHSMDFKWVGGAATNYILFDVGDNKLTLEDVDLYLGDGDMLVFGDGVNITINWTGSLLLLAPAADDTGAINIGDGTADMDFKIFLGSTNEYAEFNVGDSKVNLAGVATTILTITSTLTGETGDNAVELTVTDSQTLASGTSRGIHISYTSSGAKTGGEVDGMGIDLTISANIAGYAYGLALYTTTSDNPDISFLSALSIYADDVGIGTIGGFVCIDVGKTSTHKGVGRDAFMRFRTHSGTTDSVFLIEGSNMADYLLNWSSGVGVPWESGDITDGKACTGGLRCNINGVVGVIPLYED